VTSDYDGDPFEIEPIAPRALCLTVRDKVRGRRARQLAVRLETLAIEGTRRAVLDLRETSFLDSLGTAALEDALARGLRLHVVVRRSFSFDGPFTARSLTRQGLRLHHSLQEALDTVRDLSGSGLVLA